MAHDPPPDLAHFRSQASRGCSSIAASDCWHAGTVTFDEFTARGTPETATLFDLRWRLRRGRCGGRNPDEGRTGHNGPAPTAGTFLV